MKTATRFSPRLNTPVNTTESGITRRGNWVLRTTLSWLTTEVTEREVASWKNVKRTTPKQEQDRIMRAPPNPL